MTQGFSFRKPSATPTAPAAAAQTQVAAPAAQVAPVTRPAQSAQQNATRVVPPKGIFSGTSQAGKMFNKEYFQDGTYWVRVEDTKTIQPRNDRPWFIIEATVVKVVDDPEGKANRVGSKPSQTIKTSWDGWLRNTKNFIVAAESIQDDVAEATSDEEWDDAGGMVFGLDNPFRGRILELTAKSVLTQLGKQLQNQGLAEAAIKVTKGAMFTQHNYVRRVSIEHEVLTTVAPEHVKMLWPRGVEAEVEAERRELAAMGGA